MTSLNDVNSDQGLRDLAVKYTLQYPAKRANTDRARWDAGLKPLDHDPVAGERVWLYATGRVRPAVVFGHGRTKVYVYHSTPTTIENNRPWGGDPTYIKRVHRAALYQEVQG